MGNISDEAIKDECRDVCFPHEEDQPTEIYIIFSKNMCILYYHSVMGFIAEEIPTLMSGIYIEYPARDFKKMVKDTTKILVEYFCNNKKYHRERNQRDERLSKIPNNKLAKDKRRETLQKIAKSLMLSLGGIYHKGTDNMVELTHINYTPKALELAKQLDDLITNTEEYEYIDWVDRSPLCKLNKPKKKEVKKLLMQTLDPATIHNKSERVDAIIEALEEKFNMK